MLYRIEYHTTLEYERPVFEQAGELRLLPRSEGYQTLKNFELRLDPEARLSHYVDAYGNRVHCFNILPAHESLSIRLRAEVENHLGNPFDFIPAAPEEERRRLDRTLRENPRMLDFVLSVSDTVPALESLPEKLRWPHWDPSQNLIQAGLEAMAWISEHFTYLPGSSSVHCPLREIFEKRAGVCQDFTHLLIAIARSWGVPARYAMGYQYLAPEAAEEIAPATHAWAEIYLPDRGWQGFDPSQQLLANDGYLPVAVGRDSQDAAPHRGCYKGGAAGREPRVELRVAQQQ